jgi:hypothetical protein
MLPDPFRPESRLSGGRWARLAGAAALSWLAACVCPPSLEDWAELGFRTPEETLRSFQLAVRADAPRVEYLCLSTALRRGLPQIAWREAREQWYAENPFLRSGIAGAKVVDSLRLDERRHRFLVESYGRRYVVELVREDFYQVYAAGQLVADDLLPYRRAQRGRDDFGDFVSVSAPEAGSSLVSGGVPVPEGIVPSTISELRIGQEWKVDLLRPAEASDTPSRSSDPTP